MNKEEIKAIEYFEDKIKNKLPLYEETYVDGKPYRRNILQLETNFTEEQANKTEILLNLIDKLQKEIESKNKQIKLMQEMNLPEEIEINYISKDIIRNFIKEELPDDEIMKSCEMFDMNGVYLRKKLEELLGDSNE